MMMQQRVVEDVDDLKRWSTSTSVGSGEMAMMLKHGRIDENTTNNNNRNNNRHHFPYNNYNMDYHMNMLSASQETFEKTLSTYPPGSYYPIKHLMSKGDLHLPSTKQTTIYSVEESKKMTSPDELCVVPSYPWSNQFNSNNNSNNNNNNNNNTNNNNNNNMSNADYNRNSNSNSNLIITTNQRNRNFNFNPSHPNNTNNNNNNNNNNHQFQNYNNNNEKGKAINSLCSNGKVGIGGINGIGTLSLKSIFAPTESERIQLEKRLLPVSADEAFQRNQLAPLVFLKNPLWSNLVPSNFVARAWSCFLTLPCEAYFFIEPKKEKGLFSTRHYVATITGPSNCICPFQMRVEADEYGKEIRYAYMFRPSEEGVYTVKVRLAANGSPHISDSPLSIRVCQNPDTIKQQQQKQQLQQAHHHTNHSNQFHHHQQQQQPQQQHNRTSPIRSGTGTGNGRLVTYHNNNNNNSNNHNNNNTSSNVQPGKNKTNGRIGMNTVTNNGPPHNQMSRQQCHSGSGNFHNFQ